MIDEAQQREIDAHYKAENARHDDTNSFVGCLLRIHALESKIATARAELEKARKQIWGAVPITIKHIDAALKALE